MLGRFDVVDIIEADTPELVARVAMILRTSGHETTETMMAILLKGFLAGLTAGK